MSEIHRKDTEPKKPPEEKEPLQESSKAYQEATKSGGFLKPQERSPWEWFVFIISFQWITQTFETRKEKNILVETTKIYFSQDSGMETVLAQLSNEDLHNLYTLLNANKPAVQNYIRQFPLGSRFSMIRLLLDHPEKTQQVFKLFSSIQNLLNNRITPGTVPVIGYLLGEFPDFLEALKTVLEQAEDIEGKEETFKRNIHKLQKKLHDPLMKALVQDIEFEVLGIGAPSGFPFSVQFEERGIDREWRLHITDPRSKATRTFDKDIRNQPEKIREALNSLKETEYQYGSLNNRELFSLIEKGDIYAVHVQGKEYLSLSPRPVDAINAGIRSDSVLEAERLIARLSAEQKISSGTIEMPIYSTLSKDYKNAEMKAELKEGVCAISITYKNHTYSITYPIKDDEDLQVLALRIRQDRTLERDLLLACSFFARMDKGKERVK